MTADGAARAIGAPGTPRAPLVELDGLVRHYALGGTTVRAVDGVSLAIARGESVAILGPSGSGKSTLMHLMGLLDRPDAGEVRFDGASASGADDRSRARTRNRRIGFVFQSFHLQPHLSALENVALPLRLAGISRTERAARASEVLAAVGLADRALHRPGELSGGQQQRVAIARALANDPDLLLADEPTGNLDSRTGTEIVELFDSLRRARGLTLVLVTHDAEVAARCQRVVRMRDGRVVSDEVGAAAPDPAPELRPVARDHAQGASSQGLRVMDAICEVARNLGRQRLRTALTGFGIAIGALAVALMVGLGIGLHEFIAVQAESVNDPRSLWVTNSSYGWQDIVGNRAQQLGANPAPMREGSLEKLSRARGGFDPFTAAQIEELRAIPGVANVQPRTFVILDGIRLVPQNAEALDPVQVAGADREGSPAAFPEGFFLGYALVRDVGAHFRLDAGEAFAVADHRAVILSYQYAEAWGLTPDALVGREVELLFPSLGDYNEFTWIVPQKVEGRYRGYRARIVGVTLKSILSSVVFVPPRFGEEVTLFQFASRLGAVDGAANPLERLAELGALAADEALRASLAGGTDAERRLGAALVTVADLPRAARAGKADAGALIALVAPLAQARELAFDPALVAALAGGDVSRRRLGAALASLFGSGPSSGAAAPEGEAEKQWGSRVRVLAASDAAIPVLKAELQRRGYRVQTLQENLDLLGRVFGVLDAFLSSFGLIALAVAALGIANTLFMSVVERTREIGVMKAVGATDGDVLLLFAGEALLIGLAGGVIGVIAACACGWFVNHHGIALIAPEWRGFDFYEAPGWLLFGTVAFCALVGLVAGLLPARRAARLDPIAALRSD